MRRTVRIDDENFKGIKWYWAKRILEGDDVGLTFNDALNELIMKGLKVVRK